MGKSKAPSIPEAPSFQVDPNVAWSQNTLKGESGKLLSLSGLPTSLQEAISTSPEITQLTLQKLQSQLEPSYRTGLQNITNTLEANNQLTGSTTASALGNYESDYMAQLTAAGAEAGIQDINRALSNRMSLYGLGLNTAQGVGSTGLNNQNQMNQFALLNYENQVASALMNQPKQTGGLVGGITGAIGGGMQGFVMSGGNPVGAAIGAGLGGFSGAVGSPGTGGQFLGAGASAFGNKMGNSPFQMSGGGETLYNPIYQIQPYGTLNRGVANQFGYGLI